MRRKRGIAVLGGALGACALAGGAALLCLQPGRAAPRFTDATGAAGIAFVHENGARGRRHLPETTVGGAGWIDYDGDELFDLYLVNANLRSDRGGEGDTPSRLYRNLGDGRFRDVTEEAGAGDRGYGAGLAVGDCDNDGRSDLYVTHVGPNALHRNDGGRFHDATEEAGVAAGGWSSSAAFLDHDLDGDLDLYVCRYVDYDPSRECRQAGIPVYCSPHEFPGLPDVLYRNDGAAFADVSRAAGIAVAGPGEGKSLGVAVLVHDDVGDPDVFVACDQVPYLLFRNDRDGTFSEVGLLADVAY
ncbi:MAG: VCBS repeat-containing protein, partial [Planctomycetes bacterium]|nr:VCBS repeat-containing protein [Planctomycetota bacterium]